MEIYGQTGYVIVPHPELLRLRTSDMPAEQEVNAPAVTGANADPISYFAAVVRGDIKSTGLASLDVNLIVVEILEAAHKSVETGKVIKL
jgi:scyllo-inositol 2-dehydrogenase (NADP+)